MTAAGRGPGGRHAATPHRVPRAGPRHAVAARPVAPPRHGVDAARHRRPGLAGLTPTPTVVAVVLGLAGSGLFAAASTHEGPPAPSPAAAVAATGEVVAAAAPVAPVGARVARPVTLSIPAIGVDTPLVDLDLNADRTVQVPPHAPPEASRAGWYRHSPAPGENGPAVLLGHVDSAQWGRAVFYELGALRPGAPVVVGRADGTAVEFRVDRVVSAPKASFPTDAVYGDTAGPELRLITCGGAFDDDAGSYEDNVIVFASAVAGGAS